MTLSPKGASSPRAAFLAAFFCCCSPSWIPYFLKMASASVGALVLLPLVPLRALLLLLLMLVLLPLGSAAVLIASSDAAAFPSTGANTAFSFTFPNPFVSRFGFLA